MTNGNANYFPWDDIRDQDTFPTLIGQFLWDTCELTTSSTGKLMVKATFICEAPVEYSGKMHFENYVLGTDEMPQQIVKDAFGTRQFKKALVAAQVPPDPDINKLISAANGTRLMLNMVEYQDKETLEMKNRVGNYFRVGEREAKVAPQVAKGGVRATGGAPAPQPQAAPQAPPVQPTQPNQPAPPVQPQASTPLQTPPAETTPQAAPAGDTMRCNYPGCGQDVPIAQYKEHVALHMQQ